MKLISIHIPKCGGTSLIRILGTLYRDSFLKDKLDIPRKTKTVADCVYPRQYHTYDVIHGHFRYFKYKHLKRPYMVWLRNPVDRVVSNYYAVKQKPDIGSARRDSHVMLTKRNKLSLLEFAEMEANCMRRVFLCSQPLKKFAFVGILEDTEISRMRLERFLGEAVPIFPHRNSARVPYRQISKAHRREIERFNKEDMELYHSWRAKINESLSNTSPALQLN